ncbi:MAG: hypothetical protein ACTHKS_12585, partial [Gaiellaceae bacterium]
MAAVRYMVENLRDAKAFYVERLGFTEKENWGPIVILERGDLELWLSGAGTSAARHSVVGNRFVLRVDAHAPAGAQRDRPGQKGDRPTRRGGGRGDPPGQQR